jgi:ectoine hydroxylase-related dioxygenase (phytanoyl-CoA dioxygenase family)
VRPGGDIPPQPFTGMFTRRWFDLLNDAEVWQRVAVLPEVLAVLSGVLGDGFLLSTMGTAIVGPGEQAQPIHVDDGVYQFPRPHPNLVCNTMWALDDFTVENGATVVVPGSNNWDHDPRPGEAFESTRLVMPAGSIAFVVGTCFHGAGENRSGRDRRALTINYCKGSMRQQVNLMLGIYPPRLLTFPRALQDILGFRICIGAGHLFATDPRAELHRRYGAIEPDQPWLVHRDALQRERLAPKPALS